VAVLAKTVSHLADAGDPVRILHLNRHFYQRRAKAAEVVHGKSKSRKRNKFSELIGTRRYSVHQLIVSNDLVDTRLRFFTFQVVNVWRGTECEMMNMAG
jgi:hypothetical protein